MKKCFLKRFALVLLILVQCVSLIGCNVEKQKSFQGMEDFNQAKIGVLTGSSHDKTAQEIFLNAERVYFNNMSDMILAVEQGKIDCYLEDAQFLAPLIWEGVNLKQIWLGKTEPTEHPDYSALTSENGTIRLAISVDNKPDHKRF